MKNCSFLFLFLIICACQNTSEQNLLKDTSAQLEGHWVNMVVEIPAGSTEKWEVNKVTGVIERDSIDGQPRTINYLGYPGNYGFIPKTLLPKSAGGDGDPLDILVIGSAEERGTVLKCKILGALKLSDNGEQDDKLIAVSEQSMLSDVNDISALDQQYPGILAIIETWFINYKGKGEIESKGFVSTKQALDLLTISLDAHKW